MCIKGYLDQQREGSSYAEGVKPAQHRSHNRREGLSPSRITPGSQGTTESPSVLLAAGDFCVLETKLYAPLPRDTDC